MANPPTATRLFLQHRDTLLSYIQALVRDPDAAEDIFQEVGVRVLSRDELPCAESAFPAWCRGVARNLILHHWRRQRRDRLVSCGRLLDAIDVAYCEADDRGETIRLRSAALAECLKLIPARGREVLDLHYRRQQTSKQIGEALQRSAEAVRKELSRLREQLLNCIQARLALRNEPDA